LDHKQNAWAELFSKAVSASILQTEIVKVASKWFVACTPTTALTTQSQQPTANNSQPASQQQQQQQ